MQDNYKRCDIYVTGMHEEKKEYEFSLINVIYQTIDPESSENTKQINVKNKTKKYT